MGPWQALVAEPVRTKNEKLFHAARTGNVALLEEMIHKGVDVSTRTNDGETALHQAARNNQVAAINALVSHRADIYAKDEMGRQPLHTAIEEESIQAIDFLIQGGADIHALHENNEWVIGDVNALHWAAVYGRAESVKALLIAGADVNAPSNIGRSALHYAAASDNPKAVLETLIAHGADVNQQDDYGRTALHTVKALNAGFPDNRHVDDQRRDALDAIDTLLDAGANPLIVDKGGLRPLEKDGTPEELSRIDQHILGRTEEPRHTARRVM